MIEKGSIFGREWAGDIVELGDEVENFKVGDRVVAMNAVPCYRWYYCKLERYSMCENIVYNNGAAYAEYGMNPKNWTLTILSYNKLTGFIFYKYILKFLRWQIAN